MYRKSVVWVLDQLLAESGSRHDGIHVLKYAGFVEQYGSDLSSVHRHTLAFADEAGVLGFEGADSVPALAVLVPSGAAFFVIKAHPRPPPPRGNCHRTDHGGRHGRCRRANLEVGQSGRGGSGEKGNQTTASKLPTFR